MGLSGLNADRKKFNFIKFDPLCGSKPEDAIHFFILCPYFAIQRIQMIETIKSTVLDKIPDFNFDPKHKAARQTLLNLLLHGSVSFSFYENSFIFRNVHKFIYETKRFKVS